MHHANSHLRGFKGGDCVHLLEADLDLGHRQRAHYESHSDGSKGIRPIHYGGGNDNDLSYYTYLKDCRYQVRAHFVWNQNRPELEQDRNENKHHNIAKRMLERGGRRDIFLGTRECQGYVAPCTFGEGEGAYDQVPELAFGLMYHGFTYPDEADTPETKGRLTARFWYPVMRKGF